MISWSETQKSSLFPINEFQISLTATHFSVEVLT